MANKINSQALEESNLNTLSISQLRKDFNDRVIAPGDAEYDQAQTLFYGGMDRHPAVIIQVKGVDDVVRVLKLARETGLPLAIRSGGHSVAGHSVSEDGIVLDLARMRDLQLTSKGKMPGRRQV